MRYSNNQDLLLKYSNRRFRSYVGYSANKFVSQEILYLHWHILVQWVFMFSILLYCISSEFYLMLEELILTGALEHCEYQITRLIEKCLRGCKHQLIRFFKTLALKKLLQII